MPLAGYPAADLYPANDLFPGVPAYRAIFLTPTRDMAFPMEGHLIALLPYALSVWREDGVWAEGFAPTPQTVASADRFYLGGYRHEIDETEIAELSEAGYGARITILEVDS